MGSISYVDLIKRTLKYYLPEHNLQQIINDLKGEKIATYNEKHQNESILMTTDESRSDRIIKCIDGNAKSIYVIEKSLFNKAYRYSIYFNCDNFNISDNSLDEYINIENLKEAKSNSVINFIKPIYTNTDEYIAIKFYKVINPYFSTIDKTEYILYPTLWIYHKNLKILEHRFDMLGFKSDDDFYETTLNPNIDRICTDFNCRKSEFRTSSIIKYIVDNKKHEVAEISQHMGLKEDSLAKLKVGKNMVMPFIGDLEIMMEENKELFLRTTDTQIIKKLLDQYIKDIRKNAKYKSRVLSWLREEYKSISINILFSYRDKKYDLYNFLEPKKNNMELMNYAIKYIWEVKRDIETIEQV